MKLGAQFYSIRTHTKTPEELRESFRKIHEIGYEVAQMSAIGAIEPERLREISEEFSLPITCTHSAYDRIVHDTDALIREHKIYGCSVIGLSALPPVYRGSVEGIEAFLREIDTPARKIRDAGLRLAYHNHAFEFDRLEDGSRVYDRLLEAEQLDFIADVYWMAYAGEDPLRYIALLGGKRMTNIHYKDMKTAPQGEICACGEGVMDFAAITDACVKAEIPYALVEQDNAPDRGDPFAKMKTSFAYLAPIVRK